MPSIADLGSGPGHAYPDRPRARPHHHPHHPGHARTRGPAVPARQPSLADRALRQRPGRQPHVSGGCPRHRQPRPGQGQPRRPRGLRPRAVGDRVLALACATPSTGKTSHRSGPVPGQGSWHPCATWPSAPCAWPGAPTLPKQPDGPAGPWTGHSPSSTSPNDRGTTVAAGAAPAAVPASWPHAGGEGPRPRKALQRPGPAAPPDQPHAARPPLRPP